MNRVGRFWWRVPQNRIRWTTGLVKMCGDFKEEFDRLVLLTGMSVREKQRRAQSSQMMHGKDYVFTGGVAGCGWWRDGLGAVERVDRWMNYVYLKYGILTVSLSLCMIRFSACHIENYANKHVELISAPVDQPTRRLQSTEQGHRRPFK